MSFRLTPLESCSQSAAQLGANLFGADSKLLQRVRAEGGADRDVGGIAATGDQDAADARRLCRASKVYQRPPRYASNQPEKSMGAADGGTPMSPRYPVQ